MNNGRSQKENEEYNQFLIKATNFSLNLINDLHFNYDNRNLNLSIINPNNVYYDIKKQNTKEFVNKKKDNFKYISSLVKIYSHNSKKIYTDKNKIYNENDIQHLIEINDKKESKIENNNNNNINSINATQISQKDNINFTNSRNTRNVVESNLTNSNDNLNPHFNTIAVIKSPNNNIRRQTVNNVSIYSTNQSSLETNFKQPYQKINKSYNNNNNKIQIKTPNTSRISGRNNQYIIPKTNLSFIEDPTNNTIIINTDEFYKQIQFENIQNSPKKKQKVKNACYQKPLIPKVILPKNDQNDDTLYKRTDNQKYNVNNNTYIKTLKEQKKSKYDYVLNFDSKNENIPKSQSNNLNISNEFNQDKEIIKNINQSKELNKNKKKKKNVKEKEKPIIVTLNENENENPKGNVIEVFLEENENDAKTNKENNINLVSEDKYIHKEIKSKRNQPYIVSFGNNPIQNQQYISSKETHNKPIYIPLNLEQENISVIDSQSHDFSMLSNEQSNYSNNNIYSHERSDVFGGPTESQVNIFSVIDQNSGTLRFSFRPQTPTKCIDKKNSIKIDNDPPKSKTSIINVTLDNEEMFQTEKPKLQLTPVKKCPKVKKIKKDKNNLKKRLVFEPD